MEQPHVILGLFSFLQLIFMFMLKRNLDTQDSLFLTIETNRRELLFKIDKNAEDSHADRVKMSDEYTRVLDKHYVTTGQLNTLEEKLIGQIKNLSTSIEHLTEAIKTRYRDD